MPLKPLSVKVQQNDLWQDDDGRYDHYALVLDIDGYEGPLHLLLELARVQKVDLAQISILDLSKQYLKFIQTAQDLRIELAADYLVMAAWLGFLKSRLMLANQRSPQEEMAVEDMSAVLAFRLHRLDVMRKTGALLRGLPQTGSATLLHGQAYGVRTKTNATYDTDLLSLLKAYGSIRVQARRRQSVIMHCVVLSLQEARARLQRALQTLWPHLNAGLTKQDSFDEDVQEDDKQSAPNKWRNFTDVLPSASDFPADMPYKSIVASTFLVGLEMTKEGQLTWQQSTAFSPLYVCASTPTTLDERPTD